MRFDRGAHRDIATQVPDYDADTLQPWLDGRDLDGPVARPRRAQRDTRAEHIRRR